MEQQRVVTINPQTCTVCGGQDGVLVEADEDSYIHPYCERIVESDD